MFWIVTWWQLQRTSKEGMWLNNFLKFMRGLKSSIVAIFQKGLGWPCPVIAAPMRVPMNTSFNSKVICG